MVYCENCGYINREEASSCSICGVDLFPTNPLPPGEKPLLQSPDIPSDLADAERIDPELVLALYIENDKVLMPFPSGSELMLGRHTIPLTRTNLEPLENSPYLSMLKGRPLMLPRVVSFLTLTPFGAIEAGVSREHALLQHEYRRVTITDCSSRNGTYLNGTRLLPGEKKTLQHGHEVSLGALRIMVQFEPRAAIQQLLIVPPMPSS